MKNINYNYTGGFRLSNIGNIDFSDFDNFTEKYWKHQLYDVNEMDKYLGVFREQKMPAKPEPSDEIEIYKELLHKIRIQNIEKYDKIHKGTPFFWIGWNSFLIKNYDQAIFYLDAALAEDRKNHTKWMINPEDRKPYPTWFLSGAAMFLRLGSIGYRRFYDKGYSSAPELFNLIETELNRFNSVNTSNITISEFINSFVDELIDEDNTVILTTLYTFIFQKEDIIDMIRYKGKYGGTIEPIILHLFKGALIFETLIKKQYKGNSNTLGRILSESDTETRYNYNFRSGECSASLLEDIFDFISLNDDNTAETAFHITCKIRNTTAHNLIWNDIFTVDKYNKLIDKVLNAIFTVIHRDFIVR